MRAELLLSIADELDSIDGMLRCVPELKYAACLVRDGESSDEVVDPIGHLLKTHGGKRKRGVQVDEEEDVEALRRELLGAPDAMIDAARWRLGRVRRLVEILRHSSSGQKGV